MKRRMQKVRKVIDRHADHECQILMCFSCLKPIDEQPKQRKLKILVNLHLINRFDMRHSEPHSASSKVFFVTSKFVWFCQNMLLLLSFILSIMLMFAHAGKLRMQIYVHMFISQTRTQARKADWLYDVIVAQIGALRTWTNELERGRQGGLEYTPSWNEPPRNYDNDYACRLRSNGSNNKKQLWLICAVTCISRISVAIWEHTKAGLFFWPFKE